MSETDFKPAEIPALVKLEPIAAPVAPPLVKLETKAVSDIPALVVIETPKLPKFDTPECKGFFSDTDKLLHSTNLHNLALHEIERLAYISDNKPMRAMFEKSPRIPDVKRPKGLLTPTVVPSAEQIKEWLEKGVSIPVEHTTLRHHLTDAVHEELRTKDRLIHEMAQQYVSIVKLYGSAVEAMKKQAKEIQDVFGTIAVACPFEESKFPTPSAKLENATFFPPGLSTVAEVWKNDELF